MEGIEAVKKKTALTLQNKNVPASASPDVNPASHQKVQTSKKKSMSEFKHKTTLYLTKAQYEK